MMRTTFGTAAALLLSLGITGTLDAGTIAPFGITLDANSCAFGASYTTAGGGSVGATGDTTCSNSGSAPSAAGLTSASVSTSSTQMQSGFQGLTGSDSAAADLSNASLHAFATSTSNNNGDGAPGGKRVRDPVGYADF